MRFLVGSWPGVSNTGKTVMSSQSWIPKIAPERVEENYIQSYLHAFWCGFCSSFLPSRIDYSYDLRVVRMPSLALGCGVHLYSVEA